MLMLHRNVKARRRRAYDFVPDIETLDRVFRTGLRQQCMVMAHADYRRMDFAQ
jgi:hypothetical protein